MTTLVSTRTAAEAFAREVHAGQVDKAGRPYIEHVARVAAAVEGDFQKSVAWLHDVAEDAPDVWERDSAQFPLVVRFMVWVLTRRKNEPYQAYIERLVQSHDVDVIAVKVADLLDHLDGKCPPSLVRRYTAALAKLTHVG